MLSVKDMKKDDFFFVNFNEFDMHHPEKQLCRVVEANGDHVIAMNYSYESTVYMDDDFDIEPITCGKPVMVLAYEGRPVYFFASLSNPNYNLEYDMEDLVVYLDNQESSDYVRVCGSNVVKTPDAALRYLIDKYKHEDSSCRFHYVDPRIEEEKMLSMFGL